MSVRVHRHLEGDYFLCERMRNGQDCCFDCHHKSPAFTAIPDTEATRGVLAEAKEYTNQIVEYGSGNEDVSPLRALLALFEEEK